MNPLTDLIPAKYRKYVYALAAAAAVVYGVYEASNHDWKETAIAVVGLVVSGLAHANVGTTPTTDDQIGRR